MPQNNITDQLPGVEFPPPLAPSEIKSLQKARLSAVADDAARFKTLRNDFFVE